MTIDNKGDDTMKNFQTVKEMNNSDLLNAYKELKMENLPAGENSVVRALQGRLFKSEGKTISLDRVKYAVAMEMLERFYDKKGENSNGKI